MIAKLDPTFDMSDEVDKSKDESPIILPAYRAIVDFEDVLKEGALPTDLAPDSLRDIMGILSRALSEVKFATSKLPPESAVVAKTSAWKARVGRMVESLEDVLKDEAESAQDTAARSKVDYKAWLKSFGEDDAEVLVIVVVVVVVVEVVAVVVVVVVVVVVRFSSTSHTVQI